MPQIDAKAVTTPFVGDITIATIPQKSLGTASCFLQIRIPGPRECRDVLPVRVYPHLAERGGVNGSHKLKIWFYRKKKRGLGHELEAPPDI